MEERIRKLEDTVGALQLQQDLLRPYTKLAKESHSLIKIHQVLANFKKQSAELEHEYQTNQHGLEDVKKRTDLANRQADSWIADESHRRAKTLAKIDQKLSQLEKTFGIIENENVMTINDIEEKLQNDIAKMIAETNKKFTSDKGYIKRNIEDGSNTVQHYIGSIESVQGHTESLLNEFETKHSGIIKSVSGAKNRAKGKGDLRTVILNEINTKINESMEGCKEFFDDKFRTLSTQFGAEISRIQTQLECIKKSN